MDTQKVLSGYWDVTTGVWGGEPGDLWGLARKTGN
jgi:hypothetical protein